MYDELLFLLFSHKLDYQKMKLYFHVVIDLNEQVTAALDVPDTVTFEDCIVSISNAMSAKYEIPCDPAIFYVFSQKNKNINRDMKISSVDDKSEFKVIQNVNKKHPIKIEENNKPKFQITSENVKTLVKQASDCLSKNLKSKALSIYKEILKANNNHYEALFGMAYIYFNANRYDLSTHYFEQLISKDGENFMILMDYAQALINNKEESKAASVIARCINDLKRKEADAKLIFDANVILASALEAMGQLQNAFQLYLSVSQMTEKQHVNALLGYARVGYSLGLVTLDDVFIVLLNAIALRKNDSSVQNLFAKMIQEEQGFENMKEQMHDAWSDAPAVVYIVTFLRECGLLDVSLKLLSHAHMLAPKSVDIVLLTCHLMENKNQFDSALKFIADFVQKKLDRQVIRKINLSCFVTLINAYLYDNQVEMSELTHAEFETKSPSPSGSFSNIELQLLAIYFTVIKIFFVKGEIELVNYLVKTTKPLFSMQNDLHKTLIRNEQAFYSCISQIFETLPPPMKEENVKKMYVVGDSHILPLAWRRLTIESEEYMVVPVLITGIKVWHLRKDSQFYTKASFDKFTNTMENGSPCIFLMGEIDCREGIQSAVENCFYDDLGESIDVLVDIYAKVLLNIRKRKKADVFVHPVPCVMKEGNVQVTNLFNERLQKRVLKSPTIKWLDLLDQLNDKKTGFVKEDFNLDGVHIHPKYLSIIQDSL